MEKAIETKRVACISEGIGGFHVQCDSLGYLGARGVPYASKRLALASARELGYTHARLRWRLGNRLVRL